MRTTSRTHRTTEGHQNQVVDCWPTLVAQAGLGLLPEGLIEIFDDLRLVFGVDDAR
jgi:hypothetical protein